MTSVGDSHDRDQLASFGTIIITNKLTDDGVYLVDIDFGQMTVIEVFGMLEMARLQVIEHALGLNEND